MTTAAIQIAETRRPEREAAPARPETSSPELVFDPLFDRFDLAYIARRHGWKLLLGPLIGVLIAIVLYKSQPALFKSSAEILVDPSFEMIMQYETVDGSRASDEGLLSLERAFVADSVILRAVENLGLRDEPGFLPASLSKDGPVSDAELVTFLREERVSASVIANTRMIRISVLDPSAERACRLATALTTEFERFVTDQRRGEGETARLALEKQAEAARKSALATEERLRQFRAENPFPVEQDHDLFSTRLTRIEKELAEAKEQRRMLQARVGILNGLDPDGGAVEIIEVAQYKDLSHVSALLGAVTQARTQLGIVSQRYLHKHPNYQAAQAEVERSEEQLRSLARDAVSVTTANFEAAKLKESELAEELEAMLGQIGQVKAASSEFRALQQQAERDWQAHELLQTKLGESTVEAERATQIGTVVAEPMIPTEKSGSGGLLYVVLGGVAGSIPAGGFLLFALFTGLPFSDRRQLEQRFALPVIADWSDAEKIKANRAPAKMLSFLAASGGKVVQVSAPGIGGASRAVAMKMGRLSAERGRKTLLIAVGEGQTTGTIEHSGTDNLKLLSLNSEAVTDMAQFPRGLDFLRREFDNVIIEAGGSADADMADYLSYQANLDVIAVGKDITKKGLVDERVRRCADLGSSGLALVMVGKELLDSNPE